MSWENACTGAPGGGWDYAPCVGPPSPKDSDSEPGPSARYAASLTLVPTGAPPSSWGPEWTWSWSRNWSCSPELELGLGWVRVGFVGGGEFMSL